MKIWFTPILTACLVGIGNSSRSETYNNWAATHFTSAQIAEGVASPLRDHDGDACPNILEYSGDCDPMDSGSSFSLLFQFDPILNEVTVSLPFRVDRNDIEYVIFVSDDLSTWSPDAVFVCQAPDPTYHLNGHRYVKIGVRPRFGVRLDSDNDGLSDYFEETLIASDTSDSFTHIGQILPADDFDGDGTPNIEEEDNGPNTTTFSKPAHLDANLVTCALNNAPPPDPTALVVHTVLK